MLGVIKQEERHNELFVGGLGVCCISNRRV